MVDAMNCGNFTCGRTAGSDGHGCGQPFHIDQCPRYQRDEQLIARYQAAVDKADRIFEESRGNSQLWERAQSLVVPEVLSFRPVPDKPLLPTRSLQDVIAREGSTEMKQRMDLLHSWRDFLPYLSYLPDMIDVRWTDTEFGFGSVLSFV